MLLVSALLVGFTASVMSDQRFRGSDRDRLQAFYAAHAGLEKLTADLGNFYQANVAPTAAQVNAIAAAAPALPGVTFVAPGGGNGYAVTWLNSDAAGNPRAVPLTIASGPSQGLMALITNYTLDVTATTATGGETHLRRNLETVAIPVFQFGMFSDTDLSFFPGPNFNFGGRVHTNGNLFLAAGATLTLASKITAVKDIIRQNLSNGASINLPTVHNGNVSVATAPAAFRDLAPNEGSLTGFLDRGKSGLDQHLARDVQRLHPKRCHGCACAQPAGITPADRIRTSCVGPRAPTKTSSIRCCSTNGHFSKVSLRILLSDIAADIQNLPTVTANPPISLEPAAWPPAGYNGGAGVDGLHPPVAGSPGPAAASNTTANTAAGAATINVSQPSASRRTNRLSSRA